MTSNMRTKTHSVIKHIFSLPPRVIAIAVFVVTLLIFPATQVFADSFDDQIRALQQDVARYQNEANSLRAQADTLQNALSALNAEMSALQNQINLKEAELAKINDTIIKTEERLENQKKLLAGNLRSMYLEGQVSSLEMVASSKSISDFIDKQEYRNKIRDQVQKNITEIRSLKELLAQQKLEAEHVLADQKAQREVLANKKNEQANLLAQTQGQEQAYRQIVTSRQAEIASVQAQQRAAIAKARGGNNFGTIGSFQFKNFSGGLGCTGGYPASMSGIFGGKWGCNYSINNNFDQWALYNRQCVSWAAWAAYYRFGKDVRSFRGDGNAYEWPSTASNSYYGMNATVNNTPEVGAIAIVPKSSSFPYGHAMVVEQVYGNGWVKVSQYNFDEPGEYSTMDIINTGVVFVHFRDR